MSSGAATTKKVKKVTKSVKKDGGAEVTTTMETTSTVISSEGKIPNGTRLKNKIFNFKNFLNKNKKIIIINKIFYLKSNVGVIQIYLSCEFDLNNLI